MRKIGILTFHDGLNFGGFLQTYSLQKVLTELSGDDVSIINYKNRQHLITDLFFGLKPYRIKDLPASIGKLKRFRSAISDLKISKKMHSRSEIISDKYDIIYVGSDEVWNVMNPLFGFDATYFDGDLAPIVNAYATSCGTFTSDKISAELYKKLTPALNSFSAISVRDENTQNFVKTMTGEIPNIVLDPCFLSSITCKQNSRKPYAIIYASNVDQKKLEEIIIASHKRGLNIISLGYAHHGVDETIIDLGPFEWLGLIQKAEIIFTTMFHGLVFSLKSNRQFVFLNTPYRQYKVQKLIEISGCSSRVIHNNQTVESGLNQIWYPNIAQKNILPYVQSSRSFLKNTLSGNQPI